MTMSEFPEVEMVFFGKNAPEEEASEPEIWIQPEPSNCSSECLNSGNVSA